MQSEPPIGHGAATHTPDSACSLCYGGGRYLDHAEDCVNDFCALNGDMSSCSGLLRDCDCDVQTQGATHA